MGVDAELGLLEPARGLIALERIPAGDIRPVRAGPGVGMSGGCLHRLLIYGIVQLRMSTAASWRLTSCWGSADWTVIVSPLLIAAVLLPRSHITWVSPPVAKRRMKWPGCRSMPAP